MNFTVLLGGWGGDDEADTSTRMRAHEHAVTRLLGRVRVGSESRDATRRYSLLLV